MINVVYLAFGPRRVVETTVFSALTFVHVARQLCDPWRLVIYTDQPKAFRRYGLAGDVLPLDGVRGDAGEVDYPHRVKILALRHCADTFAGSVFYLDGDTYFTRSPEQLFQQLSSETSVLHKREWLLAEQSLPEFSRVLREQEFQSPLLRDVSEKTDLAMWNAGAIGIAETNKALIPEVLTIADELYGAYGFRLVEQFAWSLVLQERTNLHPADAVIHHYWHAREELTYRIVRFLRSSASASADELAARAYRMRPTGTPAWKPPLAVRARTAARAGRRWYRTMWENLSASPRRPVRQSELD